MNTSLINLNEVPINRGMFTLFVFTEVLKSSFNMIQNYNIFDFKAGILHKNLINIIQNIPPNTISLSCLAHY